MQFTFDKLKTYVDTLPRGESQEWTNVYTFMSGNSRQKQKELLEHPYWNSADRLMLYAFASGIKPQNWFTLKYDQQIVEYVKKARLYEKPVRDLVESSFEILPPYYKHMSFDRIAANAPDDEIPWLAALLIQWKPSTLQDIVYKIQSYVEFFEWTLTGANSWGKTLIEIKGSHAMWQHCVDDLKTVVADGVKHWAPTQEWIHTWRQLESVPQFFNPVRHVHPWLHTIVTLYTGGLNYDRPRQSAMFEDATTKTGWASETVTYSMQEDPSRANDVALARAVFSSYQRGNFGFTKEWSKPMNASTEALFALIKEMPPMEAMSLLISMSANEVTPLPYAELLPDTLGF